MVAGAATGSIRYADRAAAKASVLLLAVLFESALKLSTPAPRSVRDTEP
jgi:hypothetical protein